MQTMSDIQVVYDKEILAGKTPEEAAKEVRRQLIVYYEKPENEGLIRQNVYFNSFSVVKCVDLLMTTVWGWVNAADSGYEEPV